MELKWNQVHLWFAFPDQIKEPELLSRYVKILSDEELGRKNRFRFGKHRHRFLVTRALVRSVLSLYADVEPGRWIFRANRYGKPEIQESMNDSGIRFNLSHTDDLIVCGVVLKHDIGVDVENIERQSKTIEIAKRFFSPEESADIENLGEKEGKRRFFSYWTLKESYIKACGMGLALPLNRFAFRLGKNDAIRISFASDLNDDPEKWQFKLFDPTPIHTTAVSVERPPGESYEFSTWQIVPLASKRPIICEL